jgi:hypothetical protein
MSIEDLARPHIPDLIISHIRPVMFNQHGIVKDPYRTHRQFQI